MPDRELTDEERFALVPTGSVEAHCVALLGAVRAWVNCDDAVVGVHLKIAVVGLAFALQRRCSAAYAYTLEVLDQRPGEQLRSRVENLRISDSAKEFARKVDMCPDRAAPRAREIN